MLSEETLLTLWARVLAGEAPAFEEVVVAFQNQVSAVAYARTGNFDWAQEITQETFWQAWKNREQLHDARRLPGWLCGIARNLSLAMIRRESKIGSSPIQHEWHDDQEDPVYVQVSREERELVWDALQALPETYRETVTLFYREQQSIAEVAQVLEVSEDTVRQRLSRGRGLIRQQLSDRVEEVLLQTRPSRVLTTRIMAGVTALATTLNATTGKAATTALASAAGQKALTALATPSIVAPVAGGLLGALGGLGGAWLGTWLPAQLAETVAQRDLLRRRGQTALLAGVGFTLSLLATTGILLALERPLWLVALTLAESLVFTAFILIHTLKTQQELRTLQESGADQSAPNPSWLKKQFDTKDTRGGRFTSSLTLFGIPLLDIQMADPREVMAKHQAPAHAFGWIAIGDRATGILLGMGGIARGTIAVGGVAMGAVALGGVSLGLLTMGGVAVGAIAIGGAAIGYHAAGGGAIGYQSAAGGAAIAWHAAAGGGAVAHDFAVGGSAMANETNTELAREVIQNETLFWLLEWQIQHPWQFYIFLFLIILVPLAVAHYVRKLVEPDALPPPASRGTP